MQGLHEYYERGRERDRLDGTVGQVEFLRTVETIEAVLPPAPATVADIGGGPGRYALWLAERGHRVVHRDLLPLHVEQLRRAASTLPIDSAVGDARALDVDDASVDAVLLLGPLYHLSQRADRLQALREARRITRAGGPVVIAAISRWAARLDGVLLKGIPGLAAHVDEAERTGHLPAVIPGGFSAYTHRPDELRDEVREAGLTVEDLVGVEGPSFLLGDLAARMAEPASRRVVLETARALARVPELMGLGTHLLAVARVSPPSART